MLTPRPPFLGGQFFYSPFAKRFEGQAKGEKEMKKSFLIVGALGAILSTNGYAVQSQTVVVSYNCPNGCELVHAVTSDGVTYNWCQCADGTHVDPTINIVNEAPSPSEIQQVMSQSVLNQAAIKNAKRNKDISARTATVSPKVVKKVVYEEIVEDEDAE